MISFEIKSKNNKILGFKYFWMKRVSSFNENVHCARCLVGNYEKQFGLNTPVNSLIDLSGKYQESEVIYMCGVSSPYRWENNFHFAGVVCFGESSTVEMYNGDILVVKNVKRIVFDDSKAKLLYPEKGKEFLTCRNFQFGASYFR